MIVKKRWLQFFLTYTLIGILLAYIIIKLFPGLVGDTRPAIVFTEVSQSSARTPVSGPVSYAAAVQAATPAVVNIHTSKTVSQRINPLFDDPLFRRFFGDIQTPSKRTENSLGSGVIVSKNGYLLTNNHVIADADEILVALKDGRNAQATVVGTDPESDLAVLSITMTDLPSIDLGQSENLQVGDVVLAVGNPFGVGQTVTLGIISATGRSHLGINTFEDFIQTDAAINPGNSGGALIDAHGNLVGINTAIFSRSGGSQGIGFAIPVDIAKLVLKQILQYGHVVRGWLGVEPQDISAQLAESFGLEDTQGVIIAGVLREGPADRAGMRPGDIITEISGKPIRDSKQVLQIISQMEPGTDVNIEILRNGERNTLTAKVTQRPAPQTLPR